MRRDRMDEADMVRAAWDGRIGSIRFPMTETCSCGHEMVVHMQSLGPCCSTGCACRLARRDYFHPGYGEILVVKPS